ncbi:MAG: hypothetical protein A2428_08440 [Bdellovibrionales bacterium RIFOXYC1_FULL_54_43]|nr:MAG: hypothetical protein A2428_08440 [Bdellovibrionales bacterium RIFOXYC1_FULL_54_43]OFZ80359.1 MAG: hypothetical protein A2603_13325 [Bdellovibrionales bacterium RIFOXYD1_FULL_55_31]
MKKVLARILGFRTWSLIAIAVVIFVANLVLNMVNMVDRSNGERKDPTAADAEKAAVQDQDSEPQVPAAGVPILVENSTSESEPQALTKTPGASLNEGSVPRSGCVVARFQHKALPGHRDRENCGKHRNFVELGTAKDLAHINWKSVCLRVDGVPTHFERGSKGIVFGPLAGPESSISVRYCLGKASCNNDCTPPRDGFLDAIGASLKREKVIPQALAKWDPSDPSEDPDPTAGFEAELGEQISIQHGLVLFKDWQNTSRSQGCGATVASTTLLASSR